MKPTTFLASIFAMIIFAMTITYSGTALSYPNLPAPGSVPGIVPGTPAGPIPGVGPVPAPPGCLGSAVCVCGPQLSPSIPGFCRVCEIGDNSIPAIMYRMMTCGSNTNPTGPIPGTTPPRMYPDRRDEISCYRVRRYCNGLPMAGGASLNGDVVGGSTRKPDANQGINVMDYIDGGDLPTQSVNVKPKK